jgi:hypothetical protein
MASDLTNNKLVMRKRLGIIMWAEVVLIGVLIVDFVLRPMFSAHGFALLIVGTAAAVEAGMVVAILATRSPAGARGGQLSVGEGWAIGILLLAVVASLVAWLAQLPHPSGLLLASTSLITLALVALLVLLYRRRAQPGE